MLLQVGYRCIPILPIGQHFRDITDSVDANCAPVQGGCKRSSRESSISSIIPTYDAHPLRVRNSLSDQIGDSIRYVILHESTPLAISGLAKGLSETSRTTELRLQNGVAACGKELRPPIESWKVTRFRPTMDQDHQGQVLTRGFGWQSQICWDGLPIACLVADDRALAKGCGSKRGIFFADDIGLVSHKIHDVPDGWLGPTGRSDENALAGL